MARGATDTTEMTRSTSDLSWWQRASRSRLVGAVTAGVFLFVSFIAWSMSSATGSDPDADYHLASIWCTDIAGSDLCEIDDEWEKAVPSALIDARCYAIFQEESAACQPLMTTLDGRTTSTGRLNSTLSLYPDGFYRIHSTLASPQIEPSVIWMRILNGGLFVVLNVLLWWFVPQRLRVPLVLAWAATLVPLGMFIVASTNPSSWAVIGVGSAWAALLGYLEHRDWRRWLMGGLFVTFLAVAALARTDATLFAIATAGIALLATDAPIRQVVRRLWIPAVALLLPVAILFFQRGALGAITAGFRSGSDDAFNWDLLWNNIIETPALWMGTFGMRPWGALGWLDTPLPQIVPFLTFAVFIGLVGLGLTGATVRIKLITALMFFMIWFIPVYLLQISDYMVGLGFQSRYGLPLITVLLGLLLLRPESTPPVLTHRTPLVMIASSLIIANSLALHQNIRRYVTGLDAIGFDLNAEREWWWWDLAGSPITPMFVWIVGTVTFAVAVWLIVVRGLAVTVADNTAEPAPDKELEKTTPR